MKITLTALITTLIWATLETGYFGWNWLPKNDLELLCDGIGCILVVLTLIVYSIEKRYKT